MLANLLSPPFLLSIYLLHSCIILIAAYWWTKQKHQQGSIIWIAVVSCFLPIIGEILGGMAWLLAKRFSSENWLEDYEDYVSFSVLNLESLRYEAHKTKDLLPLTEAITATEQQRRSELFASLLRTVIPNQGKYLQMGLNHDDTETVHYAAATMNIILDRYEKELHIAKEHYIPNDPISLKSLADAYEQYLRSGVLEQGSIQSLGGEYLHVLETEVQFLSSEKWLFLYLGSLYELLQLDEQAMGTYYQLISMFPTDSEGYIKLIHLHYNERDWMTLKEILQLLKQNVHQDKIPSEQRFLIQHLGGDI